MHLRVRQWGQGFVHNRVSSAALALCGIACPQPSLPPTPLHAQGPPLLHAAAWGEACMVGLLTAAGADVGARDIAGFTALHYACSGGHGDAARSLIDVGASTA